VLVLSFGVLLLYQDRRSRTKGARNHVTLGTGKTIREFEVIGLVRRAKGRGDLYAARHTLLGTAVALREIPADLMAEPATRDWLLREARVFAEFDHPSVMQVVGCFEHDGQTYLVYDFIDGTPLDEVLKRGPLPPSQAVRLALAVGRALEAAHTHRWRLGESWERGIPHGDLRAECVVVGGADRVKIMDFSPLGSVREPARDRRAVGRLLAEMLMGVTAWSDDDYPQRLPPLPGSLRDLLDTLVAATTAGEPPEFDEFLPLLEDISMAYDEGGLVPRASLALPTTCQRPLALACNGARKRLYVGDAAGTTVSQYTYGGECVEVVDDVGLRPVGMVFMPGYGLYVFGPGCGEVALVTVHGAAPMTISGLTASTAPDRPADLVGTARIDRSRFALADRAGQQIHIVDATGTVLTSFGPEGTGIGRFQSLGGLAAGVHELAVVDSGRKTIVFFDTAGVVLHERDADAEGIRLPMGCDYDPLGNLYVADHEGGRVTVLEPGGGRVDFEDIVVGEHVVLAPADVSLSEGGSLIAISDPDERLVLVFDNYFFLAALERSGRCVDCGFQNPVGVARCLACQRAEQVFGGTRSTKPVDKVADGEDQATHELADMLTDTSGLEEEMMLKSFIEAGEARRAIEPLRRKLKQAPEDFEALTLLGEAYASCGETEPLAALELLRRSSTDGHAAFLAGCIFVGLGAPALAQRQLELLKSVGGHRDLARDLQQRMDGSSTTARSDTSRFFLRLAGLCEVENRVGDAVSFYGHQLELDPQDYGTRSSLGRLLLREHRFDEAEPHYRWMLERNPYDVEALEVLSCLANRRQAWAESESMLSLFFNDPQIGDRLIAGHGKLRYNYSLALREAGNVDGSQREMARAKRLGFKPLSTEKITTFFERFKEGDNVKVVQVGEELCLEFELFRWPDADISRNLLWKMAASYERLGDLDRAVRCYRVFLEHFPTHPSAVAANSAIADLAGKLSRARS